MDNLQGSRITGGNSKYGRNSSDFYPTPPDVTIALIENLLIPASAKIWEPACGTGKMADVLKEYGYCVESSDILETGYGKVQDFLTATNCDCDWIITNPPFSLAEQFIRKANDFGCRYAFLLKAQYWNAAKRCSLFEETHPSKIFPLTWRPDFLDKKRGGGSPLLDMMWCVWDGSNKETTFRPISRASKR